MPAILDRSIRCCGPCGYDPFSGQLHDHYRLGKVLGRGSYGEVRAARLRLRSHHYSKRVVKKGGSNARNARDIEVRVAKSVAPEPSGEGGGGTLVGLEHNELGATPSDGATNSQSKEGGLSGEVGDGIYRRADTNRDHYVQGRLDWPYACKILRRKLLEKEQDEVDKMENSIKEIEGMLKELQNGEEGEGKQEASYLKMELDDLKKQKADHTRKNRLISKEKVLKELRLLEKCRHACVMYLVEAFEDEAFMYVMVERCYGDWTTRYSGPVKPEIVKKYAFQILCGVAHLTTLMIAHRDIKPENVLFVSPKPDSDMVLGDFGLAGEMEHKDQKLTDIAGSAVFLAPETWKLHFQVCPGDVWATGVTVYNMISGDLPFHPDSHPNLVPAKLRNQKGKSNRTQQRATEQHFCDLAYKLGRDGVILANIVCDERATPHFHKGVGWTPEAEGLVSALLNRNWETRVSADQALEVDPWMASVSQNEALRSTGESSRPGMK